jgi:sulfite exporter TauE/SafE
MGMCSPLVIAVSKVGKRVVFRNLIYNGGRIMTYGLLGGVVSFIGAGLDWAGVQQSVSIILGAIIIGVGIANMNVFVPRFVNQTALKLITTTKARVRLNPFFLGMVNGILPCGMTVVALGYCVTLVWPTDGFMAMIYFGLGTLPAMLGLSLVSRTLIQKLPFSYRRIQTTLLIVSGVLLIGRAIDLHAHHHENEDGIIVCGDNTKK